ncbi:MAG: ABC transporter permease [Planctomycetota bacterium]
MKRAGRVLAWALAGLRYRPGRAALAGLAVGAATALAALTLGFREGYERALARNVEALGYQVLVTGKGCPHEAATLLLRGGSIPMYIQDDVARHVEAQPEVAASTRFLLQALPAQHAAPDATQLYLGIDEHFLALKPGAELQRGGWFSSPVADEALLGYQVAEYRRLSVGDELRVLGSTLRVAGVLDQSGTQDDGTVFLPLRRAQELFERPDRVTGIGVRLHDLGQAAAFVERVYDVPSVQVVRMSQVQETILGVLRGVQALLYAFAASSLAAAALGVAGVALLSWSERTPELGLLRALGCPAGTLFRLAWAEWLLVSAVGVAGGVALAFLLRGAADAWVRANLAFVPVGGVIALSGGVLLRSAAAALAVTAVAAALPAWRAATRSPLATMRGGAL